jgi:hypothetical protein
LRVLAHEVLIVSGSLFAVASGVIADATRELICEQAQDMVFKAGTV